MKTLVSIIALSIISTTSPQAQTPIDIQLNLFEILNQITRTLVNGGHNFEIPEDPTPEKPWDELNIGELLDLKGIYEIKVEKLEELPKLLKAYFRASEQFFQEIISTYDECANNNELIQRASFSKKQFQYFATIDDPVLKTFSIDLVWASIQVNAGYAMDAFKRQYTDGYNNLENPQDASPLASLYRKREKAKESLMPALDRDLGYVRDYPDLGIYRKLLSEVKREIERRNI